jgi:hypothetical protein
MLIWSPRGTEHLGDHDVNRRRQWSPKETYCEALHSQSVPWPTASSDISKLSCHKNVQWQTKKFKLPNILKELSHRGFGTPSSNTVCKFWVSQKRVAEDWNLIGLWGLRCFGILLSVGSYSKKTWTAWPLKMGPIGCPETSVRNHHSALRKIPKERISHLHRGRSMTSLKIGC